MKTKCYCVNCKKHPLHDKANSFKDILTGWEPDRWVGTSYQEQGVDVNCLKPESEAFDYAWLNVDGFDYPITAYGDGCAITGFCKPMIEVQAFCGNEDNEE